MEIWLGFVLFVMLFVARDIDIFAAGVTELVLLIVFCFLNVLCELTENRFLFREG